MVSNSATALETVTTVAEEYTDYKNMVENQIIPTLSNEPRHKGNIQYHFGRLL